MFIAPGEAINNNGNTGSVQLAQLGNLVDSPATVRLRYSGRVGTSNIVSFAAPFNNTAGQSNALAGLLTPSFVPMPTSKQCGSRRRAGMLRS